MSQPRNLCPEVEAKPKWPKPAEVLPDVRSFISLLNHISHLDYMMSAYRCEVGSFLVIPPPSYNDWNLTPESCLERLNNYYLQALCRVNDSLSNEHERRMVENFPAFIILEKWLPRIKAQDIVKIPWREMAHTDYVYLMRDCDGYASDLKDFFFFRTEANRDKFQKYLFEKYSG